MRGTSFRTRRLLLLAALGLLAVIVVLSIRPAVPAAGATYQLMAAGSGRCLDVTPGPTSTDGPPQQWQCGPGAGWQQFTLVPAGPGRYRLSNIRTRMCVDLAAGPNGLGQKPCSATRAEQQWRLTPTGSGTYRIGNVGNGLCLAGPAAGSGQPITQHACAGGPEQAWRFQPVARG
jgi:pectinesterase